MESPDLATGKVFLAALCGLFFTLTPLRADPIGIATLGDSLTDTYVNRPYAGPNLSWTDQLTRLRSSTITLYNHAVAGTTSDTLLTQGQHTAAADLVAAGAVKYVSLMIGANDLGAWVQSILTRAPVTPDAVVGNLVTNIKTALDTIQASGKAAVVLGNVPDVGVTPFFRSALAGQPALLQTITDVTKSANKQIEALARQRGVPVVDLFALNDLSQSTVKVGGVDVTSSLYSVDGFHPSTIGQGLIANTVLEAFHQGYSLDTSNLRLSDAEILKEAGLLGHGGTFFDVSGFVHVQDAPEPSALTLLGLGALGLVGRVWRRKRAS
jgi:lysophospholipase L1-like esterase